MTEGESPEASEAPESFEALSKPPEAPFESWHAHLSTSSATEVCGMWLEV